MTATVQERRWGARLAGPEGDLEELAEHLIGRIALRRGSEGWELTNEDWESLTDVQEVHRHAERQGAYLGGIVRLRIGAGEPVRYSDAIIELTPSGPKKHVFARVVATASGRIRANGVIVGPDGVVQPSTPESWERYLDLAEVDPDVERAFAFLNAPTTWVTLLAALDAVAGDRRIKVRRPGGWLKGYAAIDARGWAPLADLDRVDGTAQSYAAVGAAARHGRAIPPPPVPMRLGEGVELVRSVCREWLDWLDTQRQSSP